MGIIREIMKLVGCDEPTAYRIHASMAASSLDFSGCTQAEFRRAVRAAAKAEGIG